jgi:hypothetical protein
MNPPSDPGARAHLPSDPTLVVTPQEFPALYAALHGPQGEAVRGELARLLGERFRMRAPRRRVAKVARLQSGTYAEVVLVKDLSASGVRLLAPRDKALDLRDATEMTLTVRLGEETHPFTIGLVRLCGSTGKYLDLGCRFLGKGPEHDRIVHEIRSLLFES